MEGKISRNLNTLGENFRLLYSQARQEAAVGSIQALESDPRISAFRRYNNDEKPHILDQP